MKNTSLGRKWCAAKAYYLLAQVLYFGSSTPIMLFLI